MGLLSDIRDRIENAFETTTTSPLDAPVHEQSRQQHNEELFDFVTTVNNGEASTDGSVTIGAVTLPRVVADQLKKLGVSLAFYNEGQLAAAIQACAVDSTLIDDPFGDSFFDGLELHENEKEHEDNNDVHEELYLRNAIRPGRGTIFSEPPEATGSVAAPAQFRDKIKSEREERKKYRGMNLSRDEEGSGDKPSASSFSSSSAS